MNKTNKRAGQKRIIVLAVICVCALLIIGGIVVLFNLLSKPESVTVKVDGVDISALDESAAIDVLMEKYPWDLTVTCGDKSYKVDNYIKSEIESTVHEAKQEQQSAQEELDGLSPFERLTHKDSDGKDGQEGEDGQLNTDLSFSLSKPSMLIASNISNKLDNMWSSSSSGAIITGYDAASDSFQVSDSGSGEQVDTERLTADLNAAFSEENYTASITAEMIEAPPTCTSADFQIIGSYTTNTTANADRNTNVRLASEAINGVILEPGEQFSFNETVGKRTEEKGYKPAPAYSNGETVQEYGGGVCQVSSTLYNAVVSAGLQTDDRRAHTYEPSYVTPGTDAAVSYTSPDYVFTNNSSAQLGIKAHYADRVMHIELFGVPVLEEGVTQHLESEKTDETDPGSILVEDPSVTFGTQVVGKKPSPGSKWNTYLVKEKDGVEIDRVYLHRTTYRGHSGVIRVNTKTPSIDPETAALLQLLEQMQQQQQSAGQLPATDPSVTTPAQ